MSNKGLIVAAPAPITFYWSYSQSISNKGLRVTPWNLRTADLFVE